MNQYYLKHIGFFEPTKLSIRKTNLGKFHSLYVAFFGHGPKNMYGTDSPMMLEFKSNQHQNLSNRKSHIAPTMLFAGGCSSELDELSSTSRGL